MGAGGDERRALLHLLGAAGPADGGARQVWRTLAANRPRLIYHMLNTAYDIYAACAKGRATKDVNAPKDRHAAKDPRAPKDMNPGLIEQQIQDAVAERSIRVNPNLG